MKRQSGFTLIEMLVGVAIMMIVSAIATPLAGVLFNRYEFTSTVEQLAFEISRARMQAVAQNTYVRVRLTDHGYVREESSDNVVWVQADEPVALPDGITAAAGTDGTPSFNRNGLTNVSTQITVERGTQQRTIYTNVIGKVSIS